MPLLYEKKLFMSNADPNLESFKKIYDKLFPPLHRFAMQYIDDGHVCNGIINDVFLEFHSKPVDFESTRVHGQLYLAVKRDCIDHLRKSTREKTNRQQLALEMSSYAEDPFYNKAVQESEWLNRIKKEVEKLPSKTRAAVEAYLADEHTAKEIAGLLGIAISTYHTSKDKGLKEIIRQLKQKNTRIWFILYILLNDCWKN